MDKRPGGNNLSMVKAPLYFWMQPTCEYHPDPQSIDAELLGVDREEGEDGGGRGEEEEEVELDGEQPGVDTQTWHLLTNHRSVVGTAGQSQVSI